MRSVDVDAAVAEGVGGGGGGDDDIGVAGDFDFVAEARGGAGYRHGLAAPVAEPVEGNGVAISAATSRARSSAARSKPKSEDRLVDGFKDLEFIRESPLSVRRSCSSDYYRPIAADGAAAGGVVYGMGRSSTEYPYPRAPPASSERVVCTTA